MVKIMHGELTVKIRGLGDTVKEQEEENNHQERPHHSSLGSLKVKRKTYSGCI